MNEAMFFRRRSRRRSKSDFSEELQAHLELERDQLQAEGLSEDEADRTAHRALGNLALAGERYYDASPWAWLEYIGRDVRIALRGLIKSPVFALTAILTISLGIGATTSVFTLVHAVLLKSLPVADPNTLYKLGNEPHCCVWGGFSQGSEFSIVSYELYRHLRDHTQGFQELAGFQAGGSQFGVRRVNGDAITVAQSYPGKYVSGNYFAMFGVNPFAGRLLTPADDQPGASPAAVMSYKLWEQKFGSDPTVAGGTFNINNKPFTIVGVLPPGFYGDTLGDNPPDLFLSLSTEPFVTGESSMLHQIDRHWLGVIGRIAPSANAAAIQSQMRVLLRQWLESHAGEMTGNDRSIIAKQTLHLTPGGAGIAAMQRDYQHWLMILMMVTGSMLLIVCANVANLLLVRGLERRQQMSLSMALGARPARLIRQALTESVLLSLLGGVAGLLVAFAGTRLILSFVFTDAGTSAPISAMPSLPVFGFAFIVSLLTGIAFGLAPAWMALRADPIDALRGTNRSTQRSGSLQRRFLVVLQAALSLVLLSSSGLLTAALNKIEHQDFGFNPDHRTIVNIDPQSAGIKPDKLDQFFQRLKESLESINGVTSVAFALYSPQSGDSWNDLIFVAGKNDTAPQYANVGWFNRVSAGYFDAIGHTIIKGRGITEQDHKGSRAVAVITEAFAQKFFKDEDPIGKHFGNSEAAMAGAYEVIGVTKDTRYLTYDLERPPAPMFFLSNVQAVKFTKEVNNAGDLRSRYMHDIVIVTRPGAAISDEQIRRAIASVDPALPVQRIRSMSDQVASTFGQQRLIARMTSMFGVLALVLASIGIYGVTAYTAGGRSVEIGVRMALGAERRDVIALILRGSLLLIGLGLVIGVPLAMAAGKFLGNQLYGVDPYHPGSIAIAVLTLGVAALVAALIPAVRACTISPLRALRSE
jgi:predicted permease